MFESVVSLPDGWQGRESRWFLFDERRQLLLVDGGLPVGSVRPDAGPEEADHILGHERGVPSRAGLLDPEADLPAAAEMVDLRRAFAVLGEAEWVMAGRAVQILNWERDHRFCGRCGRRTERHGQERAMVCPQCGSMSFPRIAPAVITLVERDDGRALLAWGRQFPGRFFSALAGFVEPGESLEETVGREIAEEVGVQVDDITYFGSQPWPFPHSLMIGFRARYVSGELELQESEIVEAGWFHHEDLPPVPQGRMSIAGWLLEDWIERMRSI